jgi:PAS domain S-box-containing protein
VGYPPSQSPPVAEPPPPAAGAAATICATGEAEVARQYRRSFGMSLSKAGYVVVGFTAFLLILLWSAVAYQLSHDKSTVLDTARTNTNNLARAYAEHVIGTLRLLDQISLRVKDEYEKSAVSPDLAQRLHDASNLGALTIGVTDERGYVVAATTSLPPTARFVGDREYFLAHASNDSGELYISKPLVGRITGKQIISLSRGLKKPDGAFAGIVFVSFDPQYLSGFFSDLVISKDSSFSVIGRDMIVRDMIRGSGRATDAIGKSMANSQLVPALAHAPNGDYEADGMLDGVTRIFAYRSIEDYPLIVAASIAEPDVLADFQERKARLTGAAVALSLIFIGVAVFQLRRFAERKANEIVLSRSRENLARAQRLAAIGSFGRDFMTNKAEWSDEMYRIVGLVKAEALPGSETILKLVHPDDRDKFVKYRSRELKGEPTAPIEYRIIRPDGVERIVRRESAVLFDEANRPIRRYGTLQDVTELRLAERRERELERHLLHSQKLEALGTLAGGIAHDLNNTLTPIMALSKMTARQLEPGSVLRENLETIFAASEQARDLVKRVLAFSRRDKIDKQPTSLREIVSDALKLLRATIPTSIQLDMQIGEVPLILADASQIHQVITNLVSNAAQAIGNSMGVVTVRLDLVSGSGTRGTIRLSVVDTGAGMDEATRRRIFEPFFTTKQVGQGTGLGLSIIEGIVADHGGRIEVESTPGKGARFDIYFPLPAIAASAAA